MNTLLHTHSVHPHMEPAIYKQSYLLVTEQLYWSSWWLNYLLWGTSVVVIRERYTLLCSCSARLLAEKWLVSVFATYLRKACWTRLGVSHT